MRVATLAAAAMHPHSCAQPRAQLLEASAWQEFGTSGGSQNRNLKMRVFENICKSQPKAQGCRNLSSNCDTSTQLGATAPAQLLEACAWQGFGTPSGSENRNLEIIVFLTVAKPNVTTLRAATAAATAMHSHSCAQPRAQLLEASAWQEFGTSGGSQNRNLKMRVFENICKSQPKAQGCRNLSSNCDTSTQLGATAPAQLLEACAWQGFGTPSGSENRNLEIIVFLTVAKPNVTTLRAATAAATAMHSHSCAQPRAQLLEA